jgi:hypothetical protein
MNLLALISLSATALTLGSGDPAQSTLALGGGSGAGVGCNACIDVILKCDDAQTGEELPFVGRVQNCGNVELLNVELTHDNGTPLDTSDDVVYLTLPILPPGEKHGFFGTYAPSVPPGEPSTLVAVGVASPPVGCALPDVTDTAQATCLSSCNPCVQVILKCLDANSGANIPYIGRVANCGNVDLMNVMVAHDNGTPLASGDDVLILSIPLLTPGTSQTFSGSYPPSVPAGEPSTLTATAIGTSPEICGTQDVSDTASTTCTQEAAFEGCTPGFWKNHPELWDEAGDPVAAAAGFTTDTSFNAFFGLTPAESGFPDSLTMLDAVKLGGGGGSKLARHGVPALLNLAAGLDYDLPDGIADAAELAQAIQLAYLTQTFEPLAAQIAAANETGCPF